MRQQFYKKTKQYSILVFAMFLCNCNDISSIKNHSMCSSQDIEQSDTCLLGKTLRFSINTLKLDTSQFYAFDEPPGIIRGINIQMSDSCDIALYVDRTSIIKERDSLEFKQQYLYILDKKVIMVSWAKPKKNKKRSVAL